MSQANEPAFPSWTMLEQYDDERGKYVEMPVTVGGLTKREYFAAMAMQGMMTLPPPDMVEWGVDSKTGGTVADWVAKNCVAMADALLAELSKPSEPKGGT